MLNFIKNLFTRPESIEVRRQRVWEEQREYKRRNQEADLAWLEAKGEEHRQKMAELAKCASNEELVYRIRYLAACQPFEMPGGHIDTMYCLDEMTRDVFEAELFSRGNPE